MASKLSQLRMGVAPHKVIDIRGLKVAIVMLSSDETLRIDEEVQQYALEHADRVSESVRERLFDIKLCYHAMRDPDNLQEHMAENETEIRNILDIEDIGRVTQAYSELLVNKAPKIELMNEEDLEELKKHLEVTPLKDLSTVSLVHLTNFLQAVHSER